MTFQVAWLIDGRVIDAINNSQSVEELRDGLNQLVAFMDSSTAERVYVLVDLSRVHFASTVFQGRTMQDASRQLRTHPRFGTVSCYGLD